MNLHAARPSRIVFLMISLLIAGILAAGCGKNDDKGGDTKSASGSPKGSSSVCGKPSSDSPTTYDEHPSGDAVDPDASYTATITTNLGVMKIKLLPKEAPNAVANFIFLARDGYYDDVTFHRVIRDFMIQTGDPTGTGSGTPGYTIKDDKVNLPDGAPYARGTVAMANTGAPNSGGAQFFIVHKDYPLPATYPIFGQLIAGEDTLDKIAETETVTGSDGAPSKPKSPITMKSVTIDGPELDCTSG
jgi:cyclophilin family peptidyl-prolyl cis-trans isomerase